MADFQAIHVGGPAIGHEVQTAEESLDSVLPAASS
jgi:hypothetical protein